MFERFTSEARDAVHVAQVEAAALHAPAIGCGHLLLGCAATNGPATAALGACGIDPGVAARGRLRRRTQAPCPAPIRRPWTIPRASS